MFTDRQLERIWSRARDVSAVFPVSYNSLVGHERLAILHLLQEPAQSTLHAIVQQNVPAGTRCLYKNCPGTLGKTGQCSERCEQSGANAVRDIMECENCDYYGFPCSTCNCNMFRNKLKQYLEDY